MDQDKQQIMAALNCSVSGQNIQYSATTSGGSMTSGSSMNLVNTSGFASAGITNAIGSNYDSQANISNNSTSTLWSYWQNGYYPFVIRESYPVYIQERAMDKGKQAYEILKALMDGGLIKVDKVKDFIAAMDILLKTL